MADGTQAGKSGQGPEAHDGSEAGGQVVVVQLPGVRLPRPDAVALAQSAGWPHRGAPGSDADDDGPESAAAPTLLMHLCHGADTPETYIYLPAPPPNLNSGSSPKGALLRLQRAASARCYDARLAVFDITHIIDGASAGAAATFHYVVETDVLPSAEDDFNAWYNQEHMPGLAAVPGTVRAMRLRNTDGAPRYHALYLLENRETFGSEPWLKVRATDWSSRVRPNFINTKRTMFTIA